MTNGDRSTHERHATGSGGRTKRESWTFWTDTINKVVMPLATLVLSAAVFAGTTRANHAERQSKAETQCRDDTKHLFSDAESLIDLAAAGGAQPVASNPSPGQGTANALSNAAPATVISKNDGIVARARAIDVGGRFVLEECQGATITIPANVNYTLCTLASFVPNTDVQQGLRVTAGDIAAQNGSLRTVDENGASKRSGCSSPPAAAVPAPQEFTLYLQYPNTLTRDAVNPFIAQLRTDGLAGHKIDVPGAEAVSPPTKSTLRCLKAADCAIATPIAVQLSKMLGNADIQLLNLSQRYEARTDVKPGTLEFWLAPQDAARLPK